MTKPIFSSLLVLVVISTSSCKKDLKSCTDHVNLNASSSNQHTADITPLKQDQRFLDTLQKYENALQVYKVIEDKYAIIMRCSVYYKGLQVISSHYLMSKALNDNWIYTSGEIIDTLDISLIPQLSYTEAIDIAKSEIDFGNSCLAYKLCIFDLNSGIEMQDKDFRLVWKIEKNENSTPYVILDANDGRVYRTDDGLRI